jgi:hypothetical protein
LIYNPITVVVVVGLGPAVSQQSCFDRFVQERLDGAQKSIFGGVFQVVECRNVEKNLKLFLPCPVSPPQGLGTSPGFR